MTKNNFGIYGYFDDNSGDCLYIGITNSIESEERHQNHLKPSKIDIQPINRYLQEHSDWEYIVLWDIDWPGWMENEVRKKIIHNTEMVLIEEFKPKLNKYGNSS